jgi:hypothetical protein
MKNVGRFLIAQRHLVLILLVTSILIGGCASTYNPRSMEEVPFKKRAQTKHQGAIRVTAAVLSAEESEEMFGVPLYKKSIQPIWLEIENNAKQPVWFFSAGVDPEYFSSLEAAYIHRSGFSEQARKQMDRHFHERGMAFYIEPGTTRSGFVFTNLDEGTKTFNVDLVAEDHQAGSFTFIIPVPGLKVDHSEVDFEKLYPEDEIVTHDEKGLRKALENLPCSTTSGDGTEQGDPLNIVVIGNLEDVYHV